MKKILTILFLLPLFASATNYYFSSVSGNDGNTGLSDAQAWQTTTKFNSFFASLSPGDSMLFKRGETFPGTLTISRSGTSGSPIIIGAYGSGAKPIITGLVTVSAWTSLGSNIYESTSAVTALTTLNMVTFQGALQPMGRWPKTNAANEGWLYHQTHSGFTSITSNAIASALSYVGGEVVAMKREWIIDRARVISQTSTVVTSVPLVSPGHPGTTYEYVNDHGFFFQNHVNACTVLGEWAYDSTTRKIKMNFTGGTPASYTIKVADIETLVDVSGRSYIRFDNLQFIGSNSKTFNVITSVGIQINSCDLDLAGINAIFCNSSTESAKVYNCTISNTNNNVIEADYSQSWTIQNNVITNTGIISGAGQSGDGQYSALNYVGDNGLVEYNRIINTGYIGVSFQGSDVTIKNNFIDNFCTLKTDGGAIYTYAEPTKTNRVITGNICINGITSPYGQGLAVVANPYAAQSVGIYVDGAAKNLTITGNTVANCGGFGLQLGSTQNSTITGNTFYNNSVTQAAILDPSGALATLTFKNNILFAKRQDQLVIDFSMASNYLSTIGTFDSNFYCRPFFEPQNINGVTGYSNVGPNWEYESPYAPYHDGGIVGTYFGGANQGFYSLDKWKIFSSKDAATVKTYATVVDTSLIRFEYNATNATVQVNLGANTYYGITGTAYSNSVNIPAYSSIILMNPVGIGPSGGIIIKRKVRTY